MADKGGLKQVPMRLSKENWRVMQLAKVNSGKSMQQMMFQAVDAYLRKHKLGELNPQEDAR